MDRILNITTLASAIYWLTTLASLGPIATAINDLTTGMLDADITEQIEFLIACCVWCSS